MGKTYITARNLCRDVLAMVGKFKYAQVDCIRVITIPLNTAGKKFDYTGSNFFARYEVKNLQRLTEESQLAPGKALFRSKEQNEAGYALPDRYKKGGACDTGDYRDYHHIGLYVGEGRIVDSNKTSTQDGPAIGTNWRAWEWVADIVAVDYGEAGGTPSDPASPGHLPQDGGSNGTEGGENTMNTATVKTGGAGPLNMRQGPGKNYDFCAKNPKIPEGTAVNVLGTQGEWMRITYNGETGWVLGQYLEAGRTVVEISPLPAENGGSDTITIPRATAEAFWNTLGNLLGK